MKTLAGWGISFILFAFGIFTPGGGGDESGNQPAAEMVQISAQAPEAAPSVDGELVRAQQMIEARNSEGRVVFRDIVFRWGDVSWLPILATEAGWPAETHDRLAEIVLRESGGCPNRRGGDMVDENCIITGVSEWNHRSDTGLLQINGVNYNPERNKWAIACREMQICKQGPLLNPINNLKVGYLLYQEAGWDPWDPCAWGEKYAKRCKASRKKQ